MDIALLHPDFGYYRSGEPIGGKGDFVTSPEVSQMFGELVGLFLASMWIDQGRPRRVAIVEFGPGSGTLMQDLMRATATVEGFNLAAQNNLYLLESNRDLKQRQGVRLGAYQPNWIEGLDELPRIPTFLVANEFFDCLPIRVFKLEESGWAERLIAVGNERFQFVHRPVTQFQDLVELGRHQGLPIGTVVEMSCEVQRLADEVSLHVGELGGCAIIIDYGDEGGIGDTLQAVEMHERTNPLLNPGQVDLTAHVDFGAIARSARKNARVSPVTPQGVFLERLGIAARAKVLAESLSGTELELHISALQRLTHPEQMGNLFKVMAIAPRSTKEFPGLSG